MGRQIDWESIYDGMILAKHRSVAIISSAGIGEIKSTLYGPPGRRPNDSDRECADARLKFECVTTCRSEYDYLFLAEGNRGERECADERA